MKKFQQNEFIHYCNVTIAINGEDFAIFKGCDCASSYALVNKLQNYQFKYANKELSTFPYFNNEVISLYVEEYTNNNKHTTTYVQCVSPLTTSNTILPDEKDIIHVLWELMSMKEYHKCMCDVVKGANQYLRR